MYRRSDDPVSFLLKPEDGLPIIYRAMTVGDLAEVSRLERESMAQPFSEAHIRHTWESTSKYGWRILGTCNDPVSGPVLAYCCYLLQGDEAHILRLGCGLQVRGQRLGSWLMLNVLQEFQETHRRWVHLEVRRSNARARRLYRRLGFREVGCRKHYYPDQEDAMLLSLEIQPTDRNTRQWEQLRWQTQEELIRYWAASDRNDYLQKVS